MYISLISCCQSYGGFVTSHALGRKESPFQCGVAVAPVTDWRYYGKISKNDQCRDHFTFVTCEIWLVYVSKQGF